MELKKGYKQTEVGVIPIDWDVKNLMECCIKIQDGNYGESYPKSHEFLEFGIPFLTSKAIGKDGILNESKIDFISVEKHSELIKGHLNYEDVLFTNRGASVGAIGFVEEKISNGNIGPQLTLLRSKKDVIQPKYLFQALKSDIVQQQIKSNDSGSAMNFFGIGETSKFKILLPQNQHEQTAIANALSDADTYITSLEKLIEKKRQIKQGVMQELLKPKDGWESKSLGDVGKTFGGLSGKSKDDFTEGVYPYIPFMNIMSNPIIDTEYFDYVNLKNGESQNLALKGDLFFNGSSETPEEVGMCSVLLEDIPNLYLNSFCFGFRIKSELKINGLYLSYYFRSKEGRKLFFSMAQGATRYNLSKSNFNKLIVPIPTIQEQNEIAERLFDLDSDIKIHELKLGKAKSIKQGMMQNLLTGKIRLI